MSNSDIQNAEVEFVEKLGKFAEKYFSMNPQDVEKAYYSRIKAENLPRVSAILSSLRPHLDRFLDYTSEQDRRRAGNVIFKTLRYSSFDENESASETRSRLESLFKDTTARGINPYNIIYVSSLTNAEMFLDEDGNFDRKKYEIGNFRAVYSAIFNKFRNYMVHSDDGAFVSDDEKISYARKDTTALYEKCSTLLHRANTLKVDSNFAAVTQLYIYDENNRNVRIFGSRSAAEIFKTNPSLFTLTSGKIKSAFNYVVVKAKNHLAVNTKDSRCLAELLHDWIYNNSTVLTINDAELAKREKYIRNFMEKLYPQNEVDSYIYSLFSNPTSICAMNDVPNTNFYDRASYHSLLVDEDKVRTNYQNVVYFLIDNLGKDGAYEYLLGSRKIYSVPVTKLETVVNELKDIDAKEGTNYAGRFFSLGDAILGYANKLTAPELVKKVKDNKTLSEIDVDELSKKELAQKFFKVFAGKNSEEEYKKYVQILVVNFNNKKVFDGTEEITEQLEKLIELYQLNREENFVSTLKEDKKTKNKILRVGKDILGKLQGYETAVGDVYETETKNIPGIVSKFRKDANEMLRHIDELYEDNVEKVKAVYKNPDDLYKTFKTNTENVLALEQSPDAVMNRFVKKFGNDLLKPVSSALKGTNSYQINFFEDFKDANVVDITLPVADSNKDFSKFLASSKRVYKKITDVTNPYTDDEISIH